MSRYIERAENTARLIEVNLQLLVETHYAEEADLEDHWKPILESTGDLALFQQKHARCDSRSVTEFTTFDLENPSSVLSCLSAARENARAVRDQISPEMWEILNRLYLNLRSSDSKRVWKRGPAQFYQEIKEYSHLFQGVTEATFPHRAGYEFIKAGKFLERADKTSRILGLKHLFERYGDHATGGMVDIGQWIAILSACSALEPYHRAYVASVEARNVIAFLLQSRDFPRSVLFCLSQLQLAIHAISGCPTTHYSNEAERFCGRLISDLNYAVTEEIMDGGLDTFLDHAQETIDKIALQLSQRYMFFPIVDPASAVMEQKMS